MSRIGPTQAETPRTPLLTRPSFSARFSDPSLGIHYGSISASHKNIGWTSRPPSPVGLPLPPPSIKVTKGPASLESLPLDVLSTICDHFPAGLDAVRLGATSRTLCDAVIGCEKIRTMRQQNDGINESIFRLSASYGDGADRAIETPFWRDPDHAPKKNERAMLLATLWVSPLSAYIAYGMELHEQAYALPLLMSAFFAAGLSFFSARTLSHLPKTSPLTRKYALRSLEIQAVTNFVVGVPTAILTDAGSLDVHWMFLPLAINLMLGLGSLFARSAAPSDATFVRNASPPLQYETMANPCALVAARQRVRLEAIAAVKGALARDHVSSAATIMRGIGPINWTDADQQDPLMYAMTLPSTRSLTMMKRVRRLLEEDHTIVRAEHILRAREPGMPISLGPLLAETARGSLA